MFRGCSGLFRAVPVVFRGCSGVFRGVPGVFRVLQTPLLENKIFDMAAQRLAVPAFQIKATQAAVISP